MENYSANNSRTTTAYVKVMTDAKDIAAKYGVKYIASEFLLAAILSANSNCSQTLKAYGITPVSYYKRLSDNIDVNYTKEGFTPRAKNMVNYSEQVAIESGCKFVAISGKLASKYSNQASLNFGMSLFSTSSKNPSFAANKILTC